MPMVMINNGFKFNKLHNVNKKIQLMELLLVNGNNIEEKYQPKNKNLKSKQSLVRIGKSLITKVNLRIYNLIG